MLKALTELYDLSLAEFRKDLVRDTFAGLQPLSGVALVQAVELMRIYGLNPEAIDATTGEMTCPQ